MAHCALCQKQNIEDFSVLVLMSDKDFHESTISLVSLLHGSSFKTNGAHGVSPLLRPCWIPQYQLPLCARMDQQYALHSIVSATNMNRRLTLQQRIFVCKCYFKWESPSRVRTEYIQTFLGEVPPSRFTIHEIMKKFETTGSVANKKWNCKHTVLTEETLDEIGASFERTPTKSIPKLAQRVGISESSAHRQLNY